MSAGLPTAGALALLAVVASATATGAGAAAPDPWPEIEMRELSPREWLQRVQEKLGQKYKVDPAELRLSPAPPKLAAFVRGPATPPGKKRARPARPRRWEIVVVDVAGQQRGRFRAVTAPGSDEPPKDLRFLDDDRLVYEVVETPKPAAVQKRGKARKGKSKVVKKAARKTASAKDASKQASKMAAAALAAEAGPRRLFVIQPIGRRARAIRCQGVRFAFTGKHDRLAFVSGSPTAGFVSVNGVQVYPRKGRTLISSDPVWSRDGLGLAFLETPTRKPARLVLLASYDNPREDTTWELPPSAPLAGARVSWARPGRLVVGKNGGKPVFTASFEREDASAAEAFTP